MMKANVFVLAAMLIAAPHAFAHELEKGPNGGRVADAGTYHIELVAKGNAVEVFLTGAGEKPISPVGFKGIAILSVGGKSERIVLQASESTRLSGKSTGPLPSAPKGVVQITSPDGKNAQAKFN